MPKCIPKEDLLAALHRLTLKNEEEMVDDIKNGKSLRFDVTALKPSDLVGFLKKDNASVLAIKELVGEAFYKKIGHIQNKDIESVSDFMDTVFSDPKLAIPRAIGLQNVLDAVKGESDKMHNNGIKPESISTNGITPNVPTRRIASVIGRKFMYQTGNMFRGTDENSLSGVEIEVMYHKIGMRILEDLKEIGVIGIAENGTYINDFVKGDKYSPKQGAAKASGITVSLNLDKLVTDFETQQDYNSAYFANPALAKQISRELRASKEVAPQLEVIASILSVTNHLTVQSTESIPSTTKPDSAEKQAMKDRDFNDVPKDMLAAREAIADTGVHLTRSNHKFIKQLSEEYLKNGLKKGFEDFALTLTASRSNRGDLTRIFGIDDSQTTLGKQESQRGQNLSTVAPMEDLLNNYLNLLDEDGNPKDMYFKHSFIRTMRLTNMDTILNSHATKFARQGLTTGEVTFNLKTPKGIEAYKHMVSELADESGFAVEDIVNKGKHTDLEDYLQAYETLFLGKESSLSEKLGFLETVIEENPQFTGIPTAALSSFAAILDVRNGLETGSLTTEYSTKSDAIASGGLIVLMEALGTNPAVAEVLREMGILNSDKKQSLNDVYGILQRVIDKYTRESGLTRSEDLVNGISKKKYTPVMSALMQSEIYTKTDKDGKKYYDTRQLSKGPTMTLIYGQGATAAKDNIAGDIADLLFGNVQKQDASSKAAGTYIAQLLDKDVNILQDPTVYADVITALKKDNAPADILYTELNQNVANALFQERTETLTEVFAVLTDIQKKQGGHIHLMPVSAMLDPTIAFTVKNLKKYGMPIQKIFDIEKSVEDEDGTVHEVSTREERLTFTTVLANATHNKDSYDIYTAIANTIKAEEYNGKGFIVVHDEIITDPVTGVESKKNYIKTFKAMARDYDISDVLLQAAELYDPTNPGIAPLRAKIDKAIKIKQDIIDSEFNDATQSVFGQDATKVPDPIIDNPNKEDKTTTKEEDKTTTKEDNSSTTGLQNALSRLSKNSPLIESYVKSNGKIVSSIRSIYNDHDDIVEIANNDSEIHDKPMNDLTDQELTELVEHEITHSYTLAYITKQLGKPEEEMNSAFLYVKKSVEKLVSLSEKDRSAFHTTSEKYGEISESRMTKEGKSVIPDVAGRLSYILGQSNERSRIAEFISVMQAEPHARAVIEMQFSVGRSRNALYAKVTDIIAYIRNFIVAGEPLKAVYIPVLENALTYVVKEGKSFKEANFKEAMELQSKVFGPLGAGPNMGDAPKAEIDAIFSTPVSKYSSSDTSQSPVPKEIYVALKDVFDFSSKEIGKLEARFGKDKLASMFHSIYYNEDAIHMFDSVLSPTDTRDPGPAFLPGVNRVRSALMNIDPRAPKIEQERVSPNVDPKSLVASFKQLEGFEKKLATLETLSHEVDHKESINYVHNFVTASAEERNSSKYRELKYIDKTILELRKKLRPYAAESMDYNEADGTLSSKNIHKLDRIVYALSGGSPSNLSSDTVDINSILEFTAIMRNEPDFAKDIMEMAYPDKSETFITNSVKKILDIINKLLKQLVDNHYKGRARKVETLSKFFSQVANKPSKEALEAALNISYVKGLNAEANGAILEDAVGITGKGKNSWTNVEGMSKAEMFANSKMTNLNNAMYSMLLSKVENIGIRTSTRVHTALKTRFPAYSEASDKIRGVLDKSGALPQFLNYMHIGGLTDKQAKNRLLAFTTEIHHNRNTRDSQTMSKIDELTADFSPEEHDLLGNFISKGTLADYFLYSTENTTEDDITLRIAELQKKLSKEDMEIVEHLTSLFTQNKVIDSSLGMFVTKDPTSQAYKDVKELIALNGIVYNGLEEFVDMQASNNTLFDVLKDNFVALSMIHQDLDKGSTPRTKGSLVGDYFKVPLQTRIVTFDGRDGMDKYGYEEGTGWRIVEIPKKGKLGLAVRTVEDNFYTEGAGIDIGTTSNDMEIPARLAETLDLEANNIVRVDKGRYVKILSTEEKKAMGMITKPGHALVHSTSHMLAALDADVVRKYVLGEAFRVEINTITSSVIPKLKAIIKAKDVDHPYFIKLGSKLHYAELPDEIKAKYRPVPVKLSNIDGFKDEVSLVRKDLVHWLTGDSETFFNNNPMLQRASKIVKQLVSGFKINIAVANPVKLASDAISNTAYLTAMGVPASFQVRNNKQILTEMGTLSQLRTEIARVRVRQVAYPKDEALQKKYERLLLKLKEHNLHGVVLRGFMNSLSSDIMNNNLDTLTGLQADIDTGLKYLLNKPDGTANMVNKYIMDIANVTGDGTVALRYIGSIVKKAESTEEMGRLLDGAAARISKIKSRGDAVGYVNNFILSPNSEIVKAGVWTNDAIDTVSKETYYRYLTQLQKMNPKEAEIMVIEAFPDYKENMPMKMKILSDYGILMFPSFWTRIHLPAYRMLTRRSVSTGLELGLAELTNTHVGTILDATLPAKLASDMDIWNTPSEHMGYESIIPTNLY